MPGAEGPEKDSMKDSWKLVIICMLCIAILSGGVLLFEALMALFE